MNFEFGLYTKLRADSWIVKADVPSERGYLLSKSEGFNFFNTFIPKEKLEDAFKNGIVL